jgi:hypothetical protein
MLGTGNFQNPLWLFMLLGPGSAGGSASLMLSQSIISLES